LAHKFARGVLAVTSLVSLLSTSAFADAVTDFYRGKRITFLISGPAGSGYDTYARLLGRNLSRHIPGQPVIVPQNMPAAGGMVMLNNAYTSGARDGTLIFTMHFNLPLYQAMGGRGVHYDAGKLIGLGRLLASNAAIGVAAESKSGVKTIKDAMSHEAAIGATGASSNSAVFPTIMNNMLGTKFKVIIGYQGEDGVFLAMERGETDGFGSYSYLTFKTMHPDYLTKKLFYPLVQWGDKREDEWSDVPTAVELAQTPIDKKAMELASSGPEIGFSYFMPPDVPKDRVAALRKAFDDMTNDPAFLADAKRANMFLRIASGAEAEAIVKNVLTAPPEVIARLTQLMVEKGGVRCADYTRAEFCAKAKD
jgi:tripartite-type tricarboxylate transporter receptor subunit TctC